MSDNDLIRRSDAIKAMAKAIGHILYDAEAVSQHVMNSIPAVEPNCSVFSNNCDTCGHWEHGAGQHYYCALLEMGQECCFESKDESTLMFANKPKTEPQREPTFEEVKEYCNKRCLTIVTNDFLISLLNATDGKE